MKLGKAALAIIGLFTAGQALADCRSQLPQLLKSLYGEQAPSSDTVVCKVWPAQPQLTLLAVPLVRVDEGVGGTADLEVLVLDSASQKIKARRLEANLLDWDAVFVDGLELDTARYQLAEQQRAFGVRIKRRGSSRANPFYETSLRLYLLDGQQLQVPLEKLVVSSSSGEWDTNCAGEWNGSSVTLALGEQPGKVGYHDLVLSERREYSKAAIEAGDCATVDERVENQRYRLKFDGQRYPVPGTLRAIQ